MRVMERAVEVLIGVLAGLAALAGCTAGPAFLSCVKRHVLARLAFEGPHGF